MRAAVALLVDDDPKVLDACREHLVRHREAAVDALSEAAAAATTPRLRVRARELLREIALERWADAFVADVERSTVGLDDGLARICALQDGATRRDAAETLRARLDAFGDRVRDHVAGRATLTAARNLANRLGNELRLTGTRREGPSRVDDVYPDAVLASRNGRPATLAALYLAIGRRVGLHMTAVTLPDYVLVRVHGRRPVLLDPFHDGRSVTKADCRRYLRSIGVEADPSARLACVDDARVLHGILGDVLDTHARQSSSRALRDAVHRVRRALSS